MKLNYMYLTDRKKALHKLRVTLKKTDTLLLILRFADENFDYDKYRYPLKRIFNHAGLIREAQMNANKAGTIATGIQQLNGSA